MDSDTDQGANLVFRIDPVGDPLVVRLDRVAAGLECPMFLKAQGPVNVAGQTIQVTISYGIEGFGLRYRVMSLSLTVNEWDEELGPELLRSVRWAEMVAPGLDTFARFVTFDPEVTKESAPGQMTLHPEGAQERHRSLMTLSADQQTAVLWLRARVAGMDANRHIADVLGISASAAAARVKKLRAQGVLPAANRGQRR